MSLSYTTASKFTDVLSPELQAELTDDTDFGDPSVNTDRVETYLKFAESIAESLVANRYDLPISSPPQAFVYAILVIAKYHVSLRRNFVEEGIEQEYERMITWLEMVRDGLADLAGVELIDDDVEVGFGDTDKMTFDRHIFNTPYTLD